MTQGRGRSKESSSVGADHWLTQTPLQQSQKPKSFFITIIIIIIIITHKKSFQKTEIKKLKKKIKKIFQQTDTREKETQNSKLYFNKLTIIFMNEFELSHAYYWACL